MRSSFDSLASQRYRGSERERSDGLSSFKKNEQRYVRLSACVVAAVAATATAAAAAAAAADVAAAAAAAAAIERGARAHNGDFSTILERNVLLLNTTCDSALARASQRRSPACKLVFYGHEGDGGGDAHEAKRSRRFYVGGGGVFEGGDRPQLVQTRARRTLASSGGAKRSHAKHASRYQPPSPIDRLKIKIMIGGERKKEKKKQKFLLRSLRLESASVRRHGQTRRCLLPCARASFSDQWKRKFFVMCARALSCSRVPQVRARGGCRPIRSALQPIVGRRSVKQAKTKHKNKKTITIARVIATTCRRLLRVRAPASAYARVCSMQTLRISIVAAAARARAAHLISDWPLKRHLASAFSWTQKL